MMPSGTGEWNIKCRGKRFRKWLFRFLEGFIPPRVMAMVVDSIPAAYGWWQVHPWKSCWLIPGYYVSIWAFNALLKGTLAVLTRAVCSGDWSWSTCQGTSWFCLRSSLFTLVIHDWLVSLIYLLCRQRSDFFAAHSVAVCLWWIRVKLVLNVETSTYWPRGYPLNQSDPSRSCQPWGLMLLLSASQYVMVALWCVFSPKTGWELYIHWWDTLEDPSCLVH